MFEILFIFGVLGLLLGTLWEYLSNLPAFPTLVAALFAVPLLARVDYLGLIERFRLASLAAERRLPIPPERFYWPLQKSRLGRTACGLVPVSVLAWYGAVWWPAEFALTVTSIAGWAAGGLAILATARLIAAGTLYVRASQRFDKMAPWIVGYYRTTMYRISENPDFLGHDDPRRQEKDKSVF